MTKDEALQMCLEYIETDAHERKYVRHAIKEALAQTDNVAQAYLKGFDEESIVASAYSILNVEFRYLLDQNSYLGLYWNGAYYEGTTAGKLKHDLPWGIGAGLSFETRAGIFSVYYSLGAENNSSLSIKNSKIHFGLVSLF